MDLSLIKEFLFYFKDDHSTSSCNFNDGSVWEKIIKKMSPHNMKFHEFVISDILHILNKEKIKVKNTLLAHSTFIHTKKEYLMT